MEEDGRLVDALARPQRAVAVVARTKRPALLVPKIEETTRLLLATAPISASGMYLEARGSGGGGVSSYDGAVRK